MSEERGNDAAGYLGWFFLGAIAGAATAVLLTPKTGREARGVPAEHSGDPCKRGQEATGQEPDGAGHRCAQGGGEGRNHREDGGDQGNPATEAILGLLVQLLGLG